MPPFGTSVGVRLGTGVGFGSGDGLAVTLPVGVLATMVSSMGEEAGVPTFDKNWQAKKTKSIRRKARIKRFRMDASLPEKGCLRPGFLYGTYLGGFPMKCHWIIFFSSAPKRETALPDLGFAKLIPLFVPDRTVKDVKYCAADPFLG
jgi:hypothetical protein